MGYNVYGSGELRIATKNLGAAWEAIVKLNREAPDEIKLGGSFSGGKQVSSWFSWMPANLEELENVSNAVQRLGFDTAQDNEGLLIGRYENKIGQEALFFAVLAPFIEDGEYEWTGEDSAFWKWIFQEGEMRVLQGYRGYHDGEVVTPNSLTGPRFMGKWWK
jgi:hypothetical protein